MDISLSHLLSLARFTLQSPREGARMVMSANVPTSARWAALALMAIGSAVLAHLSFGLMPAEMRDQMGAAMRNPFGTAIFQAFLMVASVFVAHWVGQRFGGKGSFDDALILMVWLQFILLILQALQIVVQIAIPPLADLVGIASIAIFMWLISNFVAELHGFQSVGRTFLGVILTLFAISLLLAFLLLPMVNPGT